MVTEAVRAGSALIAGKRMPVYAACFPCFLRQTVVALDLVTQPGVDDELRFGVLKAVLADIGAADVGKSPAHATTLMHRRIRRMLGRDPYAGVKEEYNGKALALYPELRRTVSASPDPLLTAARLAIAGNVIDFGIYVTIDIEGTVERALGGPIAVDDMPAFREAVERHGRVLYLLDNAGEIVFDRILIEVLRERGKQVTAVVKGGPIINDCTIEDARATGLMEVAEVISNGSDAVGTDLAECSGEFLARYADHGTMVISKGQGNFETLIEADRRVFFLFQAKCEVLAEVLGLPRGSMLLAANR